MKQTNLCTRLQHLYLPTDEVEHRQDAREDMRSLQRRIKLLRRLPLYDVVSELRLAARKPHSSFMVGNSMKPVIAVKVTLESTALGPPSSAQPRKGLVRFKVGGYVRVQEWCAAKRGPMQALQWQ